MHVQHSITASAMIGLIFAAILCFGQSATLKRVSSDNNLYPPDADAHADIQQALDKATKNHKHVLLVFGANWCFDCHVLDKELESGKVAPTLHKNYEVVNVNVGRGGKNRDITEQYEVAINHGIPALTVLDYDGRILFTQKHSEFVDARSLTPDDVLEFLNKWK